MAALGACLIAALTVVPAAGAGKPNLVVGSVSNPPAGGSPGGSFTVTDTVVNKGRGTASASKTGYFLSTDNRAGNDVKLKGARRVGKLRRGTKSKGRATVTVPASIKPASYFLIACADVTRSVAETSEKDNCRASNTKITFAKPPGAYDPTPFGDPQPVSTTPTLAPEGAVTQKISARLGGTVTTTASDGSTFELTIPAKALLSDEEITMTPLSSVSGDPLDLRLAAGVQLQPEGLQFVKPVTLKIDPATAVSAAEETHVVADGDGSDLHLFPATGDESGYTFKLMHFTVVVVAQSSQQSRTEQAARTPRHVEAAMQQELARITSELASGDLSGAEAAAAMSKVYRTVFDGSIRPRMFQAQTDYRVFIEAAIAWLSWQREVQLAGFEVTDIITGAELANMQAMYETAFENFVKEFHRRCVQENDLGAMGVLMAMERRRQLEGGVDTSNAILDLIEKCATFEFEFDSRIDQHMQSFFDTTGQWSAQVNSKVEFSISPYARANGRDVGAEGPISYRDFSANYTVSTGETASCTYTAAGTIPDVFAVYKMDFDYNLKKQADDKYTVEPRLSSLTFNPGQPKEIENYGCSFGDSGTEQSTHWSDAFTDHHSFANQDDCTEAWDDDAQQYVDTGVVCKFWEWTPGPAGSGIVAQKWISHHASGTWEGTLESQEETRLYLRHTPKP